MVDIQGGSGLIQKQHLGLLGQGSSHNHPLPLSPREFRHGPLSEGQDISGLHGFLDNLPILVRHGLKTAQVWASPHLHNVSDAELKVDLGFLGHHRHGSGQGSEGPRGGGILTVDQDAPSFRDQQPCDYFQKGGLAGSVGPQ